MEGSAGFVSVLPQVLDDIGMIPELNTAWEHAYEKGWIHHLWSVEGVSSPPSFSLNSGLAVGHYLGTDLF